jgi:hypothetical protein
MQKISVLVLALVIFLGQAPAWALSRACMPMANSGLDCLRVCAKSEALLTQHGKYDSIGQACSKVEARFARPSLVAAAEPSLPLPRLAYAPPVSPGAASLPSITLVRRAHAPPALLPAQAFLSVPVAQAPPTSV